MENKFRNEMEITLGPEKILLRPTFENVATMESNLGSISYVGWKFSRGIRNGIVQSDMPTLTDLAKIIYFNQAAVRPDDSTKKKFSLEEIWQLVQAESIRSVLPQVTIFLTTILAGNEKVDSPTIEEKKS